MCEHCDYRALLADAGLDPTENRRRVLEVIGGNNTPLTAAEVHATLARTRTINRVTVYRILELLVQHRLLDKISGGRAAHFGLAPNQNHAPHPHFCCSQCGTMVCLNPDSLSIDAANLQRSYAGTIERIEVLVEGVCKTCLKSRQHHTHQGTPGRAAGP